MAKPKYWEKNLSKFHQQTLMHNFLYSLTICLSHYNPRHVSNINMPIFRRKNCIHTASGIFALCKRLHITLVESWSLSTRPRRPRRGVEVWLYSFFNLGTGWWLVVNTTLRPLYSRERNGTLCIGGWVGPTTGLDGCGKSLPYRNSIHGPSSP